MKILKSKKLEIPEVFFVSDRIELKELPIGVPFIFGDAKNEEYLVRVLEYEVLYQKAVATGYPFNFKKILLDAGYEDLEDFGYGDTLWMDFVTEGMSEKECNLEDITLSSLEDNKDAFKRYVKDSSCYVDIAKLKELNVFPVWLDTIEKAVNTNIHNFAVFNNNMYNKKLEGMYGGLELTSPNRNLIIIDISGSIPRAVSTTCLTLAKNLAETFYADLMITGSKSTLYQYEEIYTLDVNTVYEENGMDNDQIWFKKLVSQKRVYKTAIVFGDNDSPCYRWNNQFNKGAKTISREDGKKLCKWEIEKLISFHTRSDEYTAAYADWFEPKEVEKVANWVDYLKEGKEE